MEHGQSVPGKYILLLACTLASSDGSWPGQASALPAAVQPKLGSSEPYSVDTNPLLWGQCGRACGACCNGTGMARNRASQIESINMQVYVKICTNMQTNALNMQTYARDMHINSENMQPYAGDMQIYASDMQRICKIYAQNMHRICT